MRKKDAKIWIAICIISIILCLSYAIVFRGVGGISMTMISIAFVGALSRGIYRYRIPDNNEYTKDREMALMLSMFAGAGHMYLNKTKIGYPLLVIFTIGVIGSIYGFFIVIEASVDKIDAGLMIFTYCIIATASVSIWSILMVNDLCNKIGLPRTGSIYEMKWKNTKKGITILSLLSFSLILAISATFIHYDFLSLTIGVPITVISVILFALSLHDVRN